MRLLVVISLILADVAAFPVRNELVFGLWPKIIAGKPAAEAQFPWQVFNKLTKSYGTFYCGGALIGSRWVLTAAHCIVGVYKFQITLGSLRSDNNIEEHARIIETDTAIIHQDYVPTSGLDDIALINLKVKVTPSKFIQIIPLGAQTIAGGIDLTISGWGQTFDDGSLSDTLNFVELVTITNKKCQEVYGPYVNDGSMCCVGTPERSPCIGDGGGPLIRYNGKSAYHTGVASFVHSFGCDSGYPSAYARTSYYRPWILKIIAKN